MRRLYLICTLSCIQCSPLRSAFAMRLCVRADYVCIVREICTLLPLPSGREIYIFCAVFNKINKMFCMHPGVFPPLQILCDAHHEQRRPNAFAAAQRSLLF